MVKCRICGGNCDPGEIVGGICYECRAEIHRLEKNREKLYRMASAEYEQIKLEGFENAISG